MQNIPQPVDDLFGFFPSSPRTEDLFPMYIFDEEIPLFEDDLMFAESDQPLFAEESDPQLVSTSNKHLVTEGDVPLLEGGAAEEVAQEKVVWKKPEAKKAARKRTMDNEEVRGDEEEAFGNAVAKCDTGTLVFAVADWPTTKRCMKQIVICLQPHRHYEDQRATLRIDKQEFNVARCTVPDEDHCLFVALKVLQTGAKTYSVQMQKAVVRSRGEILFSC